METVEFYLEKSLRLMVILIAIYLTALVSVSIVSLPIIIKIILIAFLLLSLQKNWKLHASKTSPESIVRVWQDSKGSWGFETQKGQRGKAVLLSDSFKSRLIIILRFRTYNKICNVLISRDSLCENEYKTLSRHLVFF
jgi:hypothetical protein